MCMKIYKWPNFKYSNIRNGHYRGKFKINTPYSNDNSGYDFFLYA